MFSLKKKKQKQKEILKKKIHQLLLNGITCMNVQKISFVINYVI